MRSGFLAAVVVLVALAPAAVAAPTPTPYEGTANGRFFHIIPPGQAGTANAIQTAQFLSAGERPPHYSDQRDLYTDLLYATPGLKDEDIGKYFPDASFGVKPDDVDRTYSPRDDVTIVRDKSFGIPHVYGSTRGGTAFGIGYAVAEDRLFFMDVLRHYGSARLASFAGGANVATDREQWEAAPYKPEDLDRQIEQMPKLYGEAGQKLIDDVQAWCDGVNAYITAAKLNPLLMPAEYAAIGRPGGPDPWSPKDVLSVASLIGAQLGNGGGDELSQVTRLMADMQKFGPKRGLQVWQDFRSLDDPEAPVTATRKKGFPYGQIPKRPLGTAAIPDAGSLKFVSTEVGKPDTTATRGGVRPGQGPAALPAGGVERAARVGSKSPPPVTRWRSSARRRATSSRRSGGPSRRTARASTCTARRSRAPARTSRSGAGATTRGARRRPARTSPTCLRWTCATRTARAPSVDSMSYVYRGQCLAMEPIERTESWLPNAADQTEAGSATFRVLRTKMGLVVARATIGGKPVVYTKLRATYMHELDSAPGFQEWNDPALMTDARAFQRAAMKVGYTFNWLYTDDRDIAYINTGSNPVRPKAVNASLPIRWSPATEWRGFDADRRTSRRTSRWPSARRRSTRTTW